MGLSLRVLIVEDSEDDAELLLRELKRGGYDPTWERVDTAEAMEAALRRPDWDVIVADYVMPHFSAPAALDLLKQSTLDIPFIIVSGAIGDDTAVAAMKAGAHDYLTKDNLTRLAPAVERELREAAVRRRRRRAEEALRESQERYDMLFERNQAGVYRTTLDGKILECNDSFAHLLGFASRAEALAHSAVDLYMNAADREAFLSALKEQRALTDYEVCLRRSDGQPVWVIQNASLIDGSHDQPPFIEGTMIGITERRLAEQAEREQRQLAEALRDSAAALNSTLHLDRVLDLILINIGRAVPHDGARIMLIDAQAGVARVARSQGYAERELEEAVLALRFPVADIAHLRYMAEVGQPMVIPDTWSDPGWVDLPETRWVRSNASAPIRLKGQVIGFLSLDSATPGFFQPIHAERLQAFADQAAVTLQYARLFESEREQHEMAEALRDTAAALSNTLSLDDVIDRILVNVAHVVPYDSVNLMLVESGVARVVRRRGYSEDSSENLLLNLHFRLMDLASLRHVSETGRPLVIADTRAYSDWVDFPETRWVRSYASTPIRLKGQVIGFLNLNSATPEFFTLAHAERLQAFADQAAVAIENARLFEAQRRRLAEQTALIAASTAISSSLDLTTVLNRLAEQMVQAVDVTSVYICDWNSSAGTSKVLIEYYGADATSQERLSDLGTTYRLAHELGDKVEQVLAGQTVVFHATDGPDLSQSKRDHLLLYGGQSALIVPLIAKGMIFGYAELWDSRRRRDFTEAELTLCQGIAQQAAIAFENARLFEAERKQLQLAQTLQAVGALLTAEASLSEVFENIFDLLARVVKYDSVSLQLFTEEGRIYLAAGRGFPDFELARQAVDTVIDPGWMERWSEQRTAIIPDTLADERWARAPGLEYVRSWIGAWLWVKGRRLGMLNVDSASVNAYDEAAAQTVTAFANQAAIAIENARLYDSVRRHAADLERRVSERTAELDRERKRTQSILDAAGEGIVFTDLTGAIEYINPSMERLTGYSAAEALGKNARLWQSGRTPLAMYQEMWQMIQRGEVWQGELVNRRQEGTLYDAALTVAPLHDSDGQIIGYVGIQRDITRQKELDRLKNQFISNVSHELRTPLANLKLYLGLLEHGRPDKQAQYMQTLNREAARLENLIVDLLDLSRLDLGPPRLQLVPTDINRLAADLIADRTALAAERGLTLDCEPDPSLPPALADPAMINQVMSNLMANATQYTPRGGIVTLTTALHRWDDRDWVTFTVQDTGPGILAEEMPHLFQRFFRGEAGRSSGAPGTGLGLAICQQIIDKVGGQITVQSQPGHGATFTVWLRPTRGGVT